MKHYIDINAMKDKYTEAFEVGDHIVIQEKIDGANSSYTYNKELYKLDCFSSRVQLDKDNTLRGFYEYVQGLDKDEYKGEANLVVFGEWLVKHSIRYPDDKYAKHYVYDLWDKDTGLYLEQDKVRDFAARHNLIYVPVFYDGPFVSWDHVYSFLGKTEMGAMPSGEGIVVKNITKLNSKWSERPSYVKIVTEAFKETKKVKPKKELTKEEIEERNYKIELTKSIVTKPRVQKMLHKLVDEGIIPDNFSEEHLQIIAKNIVRRIYEDCIKEEKETVDTIGEIFGKLNSSITMQLVKDIMSEK